MGTFTYKFVTTNTVLNLTDTGNISIKTPTSPNTPGTGAYTITITETESGKSYNTNVTVNVETLCKSINLNVNNNTNFNTLHNLSNVTNYNTYNITYNVQYNSGNNYSVTNKYCNATYTVTSNPNSSAVKLSNSKLVIPRLYEGNITITATNSHNIDSKSVSKTITTKVFKPKVTLTKTSTSGTTPVTLTYSVESNAPVGGVTFDGAGKDTYYTINGQTLTPLKAGVTSIKTQYAKTTNFLAYTSSDIPFTISEGSISAINYPPNSTHTKNVNAYDDGTNGTITLDCVLTHNKFNLTTNDCSYTIPSSITWITYKTKTLSNNKYTFTFNVIGNPNKTNRTAEITLTTAGGTKTIKYTIVQEGRGDIITGVNSGVTDNKITIYTNGNPTNYQLAPSLIKV